MAAFLSSKLAALALLAGDGKLPALSRSAQFGLFSNDLGAAVGAWVWLIAAGRASVTLARLSLLVLSLQAAASVPMLRVFFTPLSAAMLRASGSALSDSVLPYVTPSNVLGCLAPLLVCLWVARSVPQPSRITALAIALAAIAVAASGAQLRAGHDTLGLHRNALELALRSELDLRRAGSQRVHALALPAAGSATDLRDLRAAARGHNLVWIVLESTGARALRAYGAKRDAMPHVSQLAGDALVFEHAYAAYPESIKGLYAQLCARSVVPNLAVELYTQNAAPCTSLAGQLRQQGYRTALVHSGRFAYLGMRGIVEQRGFEVLADAERIGGPYARSFGTDDARSAEHALAWLDTLQPKQRFFLMFLPIAGHHPYHAPGVAPRPFRETTEHDAYDNDLFVADAALAKLVDGLQARGHTRDTVLVISGDHGEAFLEHPGNVAHSLFVYEENVHIPLIISAAGITRARRAQQIVSSIDIAPTLLDMLGAPPLEAADGSSRLDPEPGAARFLADHASVRLGLRHGPWKFIYDADTRRAQLFDLGSDPLERVDRAVHEPWRAALYEHDLRAWALDGSSH